MFTCPQCSETCKASHRFCPACGVPLETVTKNQNDPLIGIALPGGFVILELIGVGGMGRVYRAEQTALGRTVAVKIIHPSLLGDESASARFITEARAASRLNHPNSVGIIDFGRTDSGLLYLVMEHLRGRDIARVVSEDGPLSLPRILDILGQVLTALAEAHHLGIVHRDLKPENIVIEPMRSGGDIVKVVDFGLAKLVTDSARPNITAAGSVCGTPDYMAPEQARGEPLDARSDLYAVGVILFQLLTGRLPFEANSPTQVVLMHLTTPPQDPRLVVPERGIPDELAAVTLKALEKHAADRYQDAGEFSAALLEIKQQLFGSAPRSVRPPAADGVGCPRCKTSVPRGQRFCGECGWSVDVPPRSAPPSGSMLVPLGFEGVGTVQRQPSAQENQLPFVDRNDDLPWLIDRLADTSKGPQAARLVGTLGMGRTRLLAEFLRSVRAEGHVVVEVGPDPWCAEAAYFALRSAVRQLGQVSSGDWTSVAPEAASNFDLVFGVSPHPSDTRPGTAREGAAMLLRWALERAADCSHGRRVVVVIDDLHRVDGASRNAFADVVGALPELPLLIVGSHVQGFDARWPGSVPTRMLRGLTTELAASLIQGTTCGSEAQDSGERGIPPMYVEQVLGFVQEGGTAPPASLADIIILRVARLEAVTRRMLQVMALVGCSVAPSQFRSFVDRDVDVEANLKVLQRASLVVTDDVGSSVAHPLIRDLVEGTTPAEVRRGLHLQASAMAASFGFPIEARAKHALGGQDAFESLVLLDQIGDAALARDDLEGAVLAYFRGLDAARREIFRGEIDDPMRAVLIFSLKLGDTLARSGAVTDADGVLREALNVAAPVGEERAKVLFALAQIARLRHRSDDALRYLREAIDLARRSGAVVLEQELEEVGLLWSA